MWLGDKKTKEQGGMGRKWQGDKGAGADGADGARLQDDMGTKVKGPSNQEERGRVAKEQIRGRLLGAKGPKGQGVKGRWFEVLGAKALGVKDPKIRGFKVLLFDRFMGQKEDL